MLLKLLQAGHPTLRRKARPVTKQLLAKKEAQDLVDFMIATLRDAPGVGLAAPQVGQALRIIVVEDKAAYHEQIPPEVIKDQCRKPVALKVLINPTIKILSTDEALFFEGCLSVDGYVAAVPRATSVKVSALDRHGKPVTISASGWYARILQHEIDHLNGTLLIDRMRTKSFMTHKNFLKSWRKALSKDIEKEFNN